MNLFQQHIEGLSRITEQALNKCNYDGLWIYSGHPQNNFLDDSAPAHMINPHFRWWIPANNLTSCVLHIVPGEKPVIYLHQANDFWHKVENVSQDKWTHYFEVKVISHYRELPDFKKYKNHAWIGSDELQPLADEATNPVALINCLHHHRTIKSDYEISCIKKANQLALLGHTAAKNAFNQGLSEFEIHMAYMLASGHNEHQLPYGNIIALNQNAAVLHYQFQSRTRLNSEQLKSFLIDAGASYHGYAADISRTYSYQHDVFAEMIQMLDNKQKSLCQLSVAGQDYVELNKTAHLYISEVLHQFGVLKCSAQTAVESGLSTTFFPHGLGHYLGLQVHDVNGHVTDEEGTVKAAPEKYPYLRLTNTLQENCVITIEPGLYFIPMLLDKISGHKDVNWQKVEQFLPYGGIRIEDNICVKNSQSQNLTRE
ncbi:MAG: Xaa-Pro dipeptidase [Proteobacteria bacterium]|nr:Xaa-Pro dipeptidase [Pseudomonadota bacterium]